MTHVTFHNGPLADRAIDLELADPLPVEIFAIPSATGWACHPVLDLQKIPIDAPGELYRLAGVTPTGPIYAWGKRMTMPPMIAGYRAWAALHDAHEGEKP